MVGAGTRSSTRAVTSERDSRRATVAMTRSAASGAIGLAAAAQLRLNFSSWATRVIGRAGFPYITLTRSVSLLPSRRLISTVAGTRAFGSSRWLRSAP